MALAHPTAGLGGPVLQVLQSSSIMTCWSDLKLGRHAVIITRYTSLLTCWTDQPHWREQDMVGSLAEHWSPVLNQACDCSEII